jgi:hypothetical protein
MNSDEFWCRAFLVAMGPAYSDEPRRGDSHDELSAYCRGAADAALAEARDAGMVTGERAASAGPELERVEFTAERDGDLWTLRGWELGSAGIQVLAGRESYPMGAAVVHIKWDETCPPKPIEVWLVRKGDA